MVLSVLFGLFVGRWLDGKLGTEPWIAFAGFGFGIAAAIRALLRALREMQRETAKDGFRESQTDRPARFALDQQDEEDDGVTPTGVGPSSGPPSEPAEERSDERSES